MKTSKKYFLIILGSSILTLCASCKPAQHVARTRGVITPRDSVRPVDARDNVTYAVFRDMGQVRVH